MFRLTENERLQNSEISKKDYDRWHYHYPKYDNMQRGAEVPSQELSDVLVEQFKSKNK